MRTDGKKPRGARAFRMKQIEKMTFVLIAWTGMVIGGVLGFTAKPIIGKTLPDLFVCGGIGLLIGTATGILSMGLIMLLSEIRENANSAMPSEADELKKYKELLDLGVLTIEEFNRKKAQILNLQGSEDAK